MVRPNELSFARRGALSKLADRARGARPGHLVGRLVGLDEDDDHRAIVAFGDAEVSVLSGPHKLVPGALVAVEVDSTNAPTRITGPVTTRPEGLDEDVPAPDAVIPMPELGPRELTEAEAQAIQDTADGLAETQGRVNAAEGLLDAIGAADGPDGVADAIGDYLSIPLDQITVVDNRGADGNVVANLYDAIIVDGLLTASGVITEDLIATGAIESRHLNVVPEEGTGGVEILPPGIRIIPADAEAGTAISFRSDEESWITFAQAGEATFSVDPNGDLVAESVEARQSMVYRGTELQESLNGFDRGIIAMARNTAPVSIGSSEGRLLAVSFQRPADNRMVTIQVMGRVATSARRRAAIRLKQSANGVVTPLNSTQKTWYLQTDWAESFDFSVTRSVSEWGWNAGDTITVGVFVESLTAGEAISFPAAGDQEIIVKDAGPWLAIQGHAPWAPTSGGGNGGGNETAPTPRAYARTWNSTGHRTYSYTTLSHVRAGQSLVQGAIANTRSRGHWIFDDADIRSKLNGADVTSGSLTIRNQHTYAASGMTAVLRYHNYSTAPETFGTSTAWTTVHVKRGGTVTVPLTATILNGLKAGTIRGFSLDAGDSESSTHYGYFSPSASLKINYRK